MTENIQPRSNPVRAAGESESRLNYNLLRPSAKSIRKRDSLVLRGKYVHRRKGKALRQHALRPAGMTFVAEQKHFLNQIMAIYEKIPFDNQGGTLTQEEYLNRQKLLLAYHMELEPLSKYGVIRAKRRADISRRVRSQMPPSLFGMSVARMQIAGGHVTQVPVEPDAEQK